MDTVGSEPELSLFSRLPENIFRPLASANRRACWRLLCYLYQERFGPDAPVPPSDGFSQHAIVQDLETAVLGEAEWVDEDNATTATPLERARQTYYRFRDSGWLHETRVGARQRVNMRPAVSDFLGSLIDFAEKGPTFLGSKVRSIHLNLREVIEGKAQGDTLTEAAEQARNLLKHVASTGLEVREFMDGLRAIDSTAEFAARFFTDYIEKIFIGDYRDLRTKDHPLIHRASIVEMALRIESDRSLRDRAFEWYVDKACSGDRSRAEALFQRDVSRLLQLNNLEDYLARLDAEIDHANRKALAYLDYRIKAPNRLDLLIERAIRGVLDADASGERPPVPFAAGQMLSPQALKEPRKISEPIQPAVIKKRVPTPKMVALRLLYERSQRERRVSNQDIIHYLARHLDGQDVLDASALRIESIKDFRIYQTLLAKAFQCSVLARRHPSHRSARAPQVLPGFEIEATDDIVDNGYLVTTGFRLRRRGDTTDA